MRLLLKLVFLPIYLPFLLLRGIFGFLAEIGKFMFWWDFFDN